MKSWMKFEKSMDVSQFEIRLRHRLKHPEAYVQKVKKSEDDKPLVEVDWRTQCCPDGKWTKWLVERLTPDQLAAYHKFKEMQTIEKYKNDENLLIKFLAARKFNVDDAQKFLQDRIKFLAENNLDWELSKDEFPNEIEDSPVIIHKSDNYGRPLVYNRVGKIFPDRYTDESMRTYTCWLNYEIIKAFPKHVDNYIVIYDFKDSGWSNINYHQLKSVIGGVGSVFPEMIYKIMVIRAPWFVNIAYAAIKGVVAAETIEKVRFISESDLPGALTEFIPIENIPWEIGGEDDEYAVLFP